MSKESIRKKIQEAKAKTKKAMEAKGTSPEMMAAVEALLLIIDILVALFLEKKTRKNSSNSGLPPSRNNGTNGNRNKPGESDREKLGSQLANSKTVLVSKNITVDTCTNCSADLSDVPVTDTEKRTQIDIVYEIVTTEIISEIKKCEECGTINKGVFPKGFNGVVQYGNGIKASIINYLVVQAMSLERVQEHFKGLIGRFISQAIFLKYIMQFYLSLEAWETRQIENLLKCPVVHCDETSIRINKVNHWIHVYSAGDITLQFVHSARGSDAVEYINIIPRYRGTIVHDCWATYLSYGNVDHALCGAHILRELKFIEDSNKYKWATKMKKLLQKAAELVSNRPAMQALYEREYKILQKQYRNILTRALSEMPKFPEREDGQIGKLKHTDAQNLWLRLEKYESSVLMFARDRNVPFTNNRAERDLRVVKVKQKVAGCFRTEKFAKAFCRIMSYVKSMRYRGYSSLEAISMAFNGKIPM